MTSPTRKPLLVASLICFALALLLLAACVSSVLAAEPTGAKWGASPVLSVSYAGQTFHEVAGSLMGEEWQHDPSLIYCLIVTSNHPNLVFAGHSDAAGAYLYQLRIGDPALIDGRAFTVTDIRVVITNYFFVSVNWFYKANTATLMTCYPQGAYYPTGRLIVTAEAVR